jgi:hypothetical protein
MQSEPSTRAEALATLAFLFVEQDASYNSTGQFDAFRISIYDPAVTDTRVITKHGAL